MTIRFTDCYEGYYTGQIVTLESEAETAMVELGFATPDLDGPPGSAALALEDHQAAHIALGLGIFDTVADEYADDAAAAVGGVPVGALYNVSGVVHVRVE